MESSPDPGILRPSPSDFRWGEDRERATQRGPPPRFMVDAMLGNVVRELRLLGFDAAYAGTAPDAAILRRCQAEGRVLVTRDRALARRARPVVAVPVSATEPGEQTPEVLRQLPSLRLRDVRPFSQCLECNGLLRPLSADAARARVPDHVALAHREFRECPECGRVYWPGGHRRRLEHRLRRLLEPLQGRERQV